MLYDPLRCLSLAERPEEKIRQDFLKKMVGALGFPKGLLSIEKDLASLSQSSLPLDPHRRIDILVSAPGKEGLVPLLLIECKADKIDATAFSQLFGYNRVILAPFMCLTNGVETQTFWYEKNKMVSIPFLPSYLQLLEKL